MSQIQPQPNKAKVVLSLHQMYVEVESTASYPDQLDDISRRAFELFDSIIMRAKEHGVDIREFDFDEMDFDYDEDEEA